MSPSRLANAGEAAGGGVALGYAVTRVCGWGRRHLRSATGRQVAQLRLELAPVLEGLTAEAKIEREWREGVDRELGYLRGAVDTLLDGRKPTVRSPRR